MSVFFDMDGTLCEWRFFIHPSDIYKEGYYRSLAPMQGTISFARRLLHAGGEVFILSNFLKDSPYALQEKNLWLDEFLPEIPNSHRIFLPCGASKGDICREHVSLAKSRAAEKPVLFDDHTDNLLQWREAGGRAVKVLNGGNGKSLRWDGETFNAIGGFLETPF